MKTCNFFYRIEKTFSFGGLFILLCAPFFAQNSSVSMPASPSMPSVSAPSIGNGFYVPGSAGFYSGQKNVPASTPKTTSQSGNDTKEKKDETSSSIVASTANSAVSTGSSQKSDTSAVKYNIASELNTALSAGDISSLNSLGLFSSLSSLVGGQSSLLSAQTGQNNEGDRVLLEQILARLDEIKHNTNGITSSAAIGTKTSIENSSTSSILRFNINNSNILSITKAIFASEPESDGSFLLTGDCKYGVNGKLRTETFYFYFHSTGTKNSGTTYSVTPSLSQSTQDTSSYLYKLCQAKNLTAYKTGNLVTLRSQENGINVDLLVALD